MKTPTWFWIAMAVWLFVGLPAYVFGSLYKGSPIPDPPPVFYSPHLLDQTVGTLTWLLVMIIISVPLWAIPTLMLRRRKMRKRSNA